MKNLTYKKNLIRKAINLKFNLIFILAFSLSNFCFAQNLIISSGGQTGTSGTNWSATGSNPVTITATGAANINNSVIQNYLNSGTSVFLVNFSVGTAINSDITKTSGADAFFTIKDVGNIKVAANINISSSSNKLDIILWADSDNTQGGIVADFIYIDYGASFNSNGGKIAMAGGPDNGTNGGVSGDNIPDGFAWNGANSGYGSENYGGLNFGPRGGTGNTISLASSGGDIILRGSTSNNCSFRCWKDYYVW